MRVRNAVAAVDPPSNPIMPPARKEGCGRRVPSSFYVLFGALLMLAACASPGSRIADRGASNLLTRAEIDPVVTAVGDIRELIERLRPQWLRPRGRPSMQDQNAGLPVVYVDGVRVGTPERLRGMSTGGLIQIEYISASDATTRFGTGHLGGAILVTFGPGSAADP
jgi:hypothetical protein